MVYIMVYPHRRSKPWFKTDCFNARRTILEELHSQGLPDTRQSLAIRTSTQTIQGLTEKKEDRISGGPR